MGGVILYTMDIMYRIENMVKRGLPVSTSIETLLDDIEDKVDYFETNPS